MSSNDEGKPEDTSEITSSMSSNDTEKPEKTSEITPEEQCEDKSLTGEDKDKIQLYDASKMGFNDRAWNDPPSLLMNSAAANSGMPTGTGRKLNSRVAFPLDSASYPTSDNKARAPLNPNAPPPMGGFVNSSSKPPLP